MLYIFGISGEAGSGKDTTAEFINEFLHPQSYQFKKYAFADEVRSYILKYFPTLVWSMQDFIDEKSDGIPRALMQGIGHGIREEINQEYWINKTFSNILTDFEKFKSRGDSRHYVAVVSDVRYVNELMRILNFPASYNSYLKDRNSFCASSVLRLVGRSRNIAEHASEGELNKYPFGQTQGTYLYNNVSSIEDLSKFTKDWVKMETNNGAR